MSSFDSNAISHLFCRFHFGEKVCEIVESGNTESTRKRFRRLFDSRSAALESHRSFERLKDCIALCEEFTTAKERSLGQQSRTADFQANSRLTERERWDMSVRDGDRV